MTANQRHLKALLEALVAKREQRYPIRPAAAAAIADFERRALARGVPSEVQRQLVELYEVADAFSYEFNLGFFSCEDEIIFEWWGKKELWLSLMHSDVIRWSAGKFCVGDASNVSYSATDEYATLLELVDGCSRYIKELEAAEPAAETDFE